MKPHIGLNADYEPGAKPYHKLYANYTRAVQLGGGIPVIIPPLEDDEEILSILATLDGLVLTGGDDIDPKVYGQEPHPSVSAAAPERTFSDLRLVELALVMEVPILGICMGAQLINVALGGTLVQDIPTQHPNAIQHGPSADVAKVRHVVSIIDGTRLAQILGMQSVNADSTHHQAVGHLGRGLVVSAHAEDETIEAIELPGTWLLGVQWHPERLTDEKEHLALFEALVLASSTRA
jgi:putative glutamine amidotransferase